MVKDAVLALPLPPNSTNGASILRLSGVRKQIGLSRSFIYDGVKKGTFPAPIKLGERAVGWSRASVDKWLKERVAASCKEAA